MPSHHPHGSLENPDTGHETRDINLRAITGFLIVLIAIVLAADVAMWGLFKLFAHMEAQNDPVVSPLAPPAGQPLGPPGLQTTPWTDLTHFRAEQNAYLHGYGWIDERAGVARVPIDKAKEMLLKKGLPVGPELAGRWRAPTSRPAVNRTADARCPGARPTRPRRRLPLLLRPLRSPRRLPPPS